MASYSYPPTASKRQRLDESESDDDASLPVGFTESTILGPGGTIVEPQTLESTRAARSWWIVSAPDGPFGVESTLEDYPGTGQMPPYPYWAIIRAAIAGSPRQRLTLTEIYDVLASRFDAFKASPEGQWKTAIHYTLASRPAFRDAGGHWIIDSTCNPHLTKLARRKNRPRKTPYEQQLAEEALLARRTASAHLYKKAQVGSAQVDRIDVPFALSLNRRVVSLAMTALDRLIASQQPGAEPLLPEVGALTADDNTATGVAARAIQEVLLGKKSLLPVPAPSEPGRQPPYIPTGLAPAPVAAAPAPQQKDMTTEIIRACILASTEHRLTVDELVQAVEHLQPHIKLTREQWRATVQTSLSTHACFQQAGEHWQCDQAVSVLALRT